ncbi:MAG TPA: HD domain-containing protein [Isosphaeraceae bacterium]|nr:HD domain-containing protein [Isosphaeraceae bacterium]
MATITTTVIRLSELADGQEAECFAILLRKVRGTTSRDQPFVKCYFRDKRVTLEAPLWADHRLHQQAIGWQEGIAYRLRVRGAQHARYGLQLEIQNARPADVKDAADGYDFYDLVESTEYPPETLFQRIHEYVDKYIDDAHLNRLVRLLLEEHAEAFKKMPAATNFHHSFTGGLIEHVWSMTRISGMLADHYGRYYAKLNPPLNKGVIVASAIVHDIGKLRELEYHPVEAKYTKEGSLLGHIIIGRDMVRKAAERIEGFPEETLLLLEHAILSHHGKREFGAPIVPMTLEALIVSYVDDLDAKVNIAARERIFSTTDGAFTDKVYTLDNRRIYKGIPVELPPDSDPPAGV